MTAFRHVETIEVCEQDDRVLLVLEVREFRRPTLHLSLCRDGFQEWRLNGEQHRENGPAVVHPDGTLEWWKYGRRHRSGGPAVIHPDGRTEYWDNGRQTKYQRGPK